jgi:hypothetical protein
MTRASRGRRMLGRLRRGRLTAEPPREPTGRFGAIEPGPPPEAAVPGVGWDQNARALVPVERRAPDSDELRARILSLLSDPRTDSITPTAAARVLERPLVDIETTLEAMAQAGELVVTGGATKRFRVAPRLKLELEAAFREAAHELGEHGVLARTVPDDALAALDDEAEEPRLPVTAGLLSLFLPGTGQLLNGDVGRASLVFAVWSLAWITHLSPVWTFVCLYAGAEAFFTAKIRSMERKLAREALSLGSATPAPRQLPPKPSST